MKLSGIQIFKYLPGGKKTEKANCKECGFPTCMAFAMKLAKKQADISSCAYAPAELIEKIKESSAALQNEVTIGKNIKVGNETVMFRHQKKFINPTAIFIDVKTSEYKEKADKISNYIITRVGDEFKVSGVNLINDNNNLVEAAKYISSKNLGLILNITNNEIDLIDEVKELNPLVNTKELSIDEIELISKEYKLPLLINENNCHTLIDKMESLLSKRLSNFVLNVDYDNFTNTITDLFYIRKAAIQDKFKPLSFPVLSYVDTNDGLTDCSIASAFLCRYSNIMVLKDLNKELLSSLFTLRQNIFTDPEKPLQVEAKVYPIGEPNDNSPILITTNFALSYFAVVNELEACDYSCDLLVTASDGMSVLTAWSASKFTAESIEKELKASFSEKDLQTRQIIMPGCVDSLIEELQEDLPNCNIIAGPHEACELPSFLENL